jgi:hypothetical protein
MLCNDFINELITAVSSLTTGTTAEFKTVEWGIDLPPASAELTWAKKTLPACFIWGGNSTLSIYNETMRVHERQTINAYIMLYYKPDATNDQTSGIAELNRLEQRFIETLLSLDNDINMTGDIIIDRDTTFLKIGSIWNYLPPFYASRIEFTLETYN